WSSRGTRRRPNATSSTAWPASSATELRVDLREAMERDTDTVNTALVFNNASGDVVHVFCRAFDADGAYEGRRVVRIPARGVRYLRASDFSSGGDFIGSAVCSSRARVAASAVLLAPGALTNLDVIQADAWDEGNRVRFPLIATY
ncbi:MAG: hypothetical protein AAGC67_10765, partial [Myxococcota bacterium]